MALQAPAIRPKTWPDDPYKGLTFYSVTDVPLFAGRDDDIDAMTSMIGVGTTRIVLLHGMTGCGKSSFLRAGLIPTLEEEMRSYEFLRDQDGLPDFVRSTDDPTASLARKLHQGIRRKQLPVKLLEDKNLPEDEAAFVRLVAADPQQLVRVVEQVASRIRRTLVLVIDQAEEVITLQPDAPGDPARLQFFNFLGAISRTEHDLKLIIAFRTEYHGQFYAQLRYGARVSRVNDYFLADFSKRQIIEAILRPTSEEDIPDYGKPRDRYKFTYEKELPDKIAAALLSSAASGGVLPVMQIVCRRLYDGVDSGRKRSSGVPAGPPIEITERRYTTLGGISGQVDSHIQSELEAALKQKFAGQARILVSHLETARWRRVLSKLVKPQVNGTVTTDIIPVADLERAAKDVGCLLPAHEMLEFLADPKRRILRPVDVTQVQTKQVIPCYSLGHDVLASVLQAWNVRRKVEQKFIWTGRATYAALLIATLIAYFWKGRGLGLLLFAAFCLIGLVAFLMPGVSLGDGFTGFKSGEGSERSFTPGTGT